MNMASAGLPKWLYSLSLNYRTAQFFRVPARANFPVARGYLKQGFARAKTPSDGQGPSSRANARDLRKISPFGRNDNAFLLCGSFDVAQDMLCAFARDIPSFGCGFAAARLKVLYHLHAVLSNQFISLPASIQGRLTSGSLKI
jgi:hypothetical protein